MACDGPGVAVGTGVLIGGTGAAVGGTGVALGGTGVFAAGVAIRAAVRLAELRVSGLPAIDQALI